ncbi:MAG: hypothetical protein LKG23_01095 [Nitrospira sp.]|jgi:hypothetical protein|nr:hypothetical protein [Nitrospira sp.]
MSREEIAQAILVTFELVGQSISDEGAKAMLAELSLYPERDVLSALTRCRKELRKVTFADIIDRIPTGHPGAEEAWAMVSPYLSNERASIVWTDEMAHAFGVALPLADDKIAARMAFKESYSKAIAEARDMKKVPIWRPSLGTDPNGREAALEEAVKLGRLSLDHAKKLIPDYSLPAPTVTLPKMKVLV